MTGQLRRSDGPQRDDADMTDHWHLSNKFDRRALHLADRHYNRRKVGSPQFVPPGRAVVLLTEPADALWVTSWPFAEYVRHAWPGAWVNSLFRNESPHLASDLILEALAVTRHVFGDPPEMGVVTFINRTKVRPKRDPGYCYLRAGFMPSGWTKGGLVALRMPADKVPAAVAPRPMVTAQLAFGDIA